MAKLAIDFFSEAEANHHYDQAWSVKSGELQAQCAIPKEFNGTGGGFSPEDFFLQSLINCFIGTFKVYAKASKIIFSQLSVRGTLTVGPNPAGQMMMKKAKLSIQINGCDRPDRVKTIVDKVIREGFVLNSVKTEIEYAFEIT